MNGWIAECIPGRGLPWVDRAAASLTDQAHRDGLHINSPAAHARITELERGGVEPLPATRAGAP